MTHGARNEASRDYEGLQQMGDVENEAEEVTIPAPMAAREPTGDDAVDEVLGQLDAVAETPLDSQIQVGEQVHRVLQGRLADLGKE